MWLNSLKTMLLMTTLAAILMALGSLMGGQAGLLAAFIVALILNGIMYFFSDRIVLAMYNAKPLDRTKYAEIYHTVTELSARMGIPVPKLWLVETPVANAFATGRNPAHSSVAVTTGLLDILSPHEVRGVLAHELSHVVNRDVLVSTIAATFATAIGYCANFMQYALIWGGNRRDDRQGGMGIIGALIMIILMPIIATLIRLGISRSREYLADETGADCCKDPLALASALKKLASHTRTASFSANDATREATAGLFIVRPFSGEAFLELLSTHPPLKKRVEALERMHAKNTGW